METKPRKSLSILSLALYGLGLILGVAVIAVAAWGGMESAFFDHVPNSDKILTSLRCPMLISDQETATIGVTITNPSQYKVNPGVTANISAGYFTVSEEYSDRIMLDPGQSAQMTWQASVANAAYNRSLIFVHVSISPSYPLEAANGTCGIVVLKLGGIRGQLLLDSVAVLAMLLVAAGLWIWHRQHSTDRNLKMRSLNNGLRALALVLLLGVLLSFLKLWFLGVLSLVVVILLVIIFWSQYGVSTD